MLKISLGRHKYQIGIKTRMYRNKISLFGRFVCLFVEKINFAIMKIFVINILTIICACIIFAPASLQGIPRTEGSGRVYASAEDTLVFERYIKYMERKGRMPFDWVLMETACFFNGTPYAGGTLELEPEGLVVNLHQLDCFTFVETVIALSRMFFLGERRFVDFCSHLRRLRYRDGEVCGYVSRLHYTSDWMYENERCGLVHRVGSEAGGRPYAFNLNFMSTHSSAYRQLSADTALVIAMAEIERVISRRRNYYYFAEKEIDSLAGKVQNGDVVAFLTSVRGLDVSHVGFITGLPGKLTFIHASSAGKKVMIHQTTLSDYVRASRTCTGIMTARPLPPFIGIFQRQISPLWPDSLIWQSWQRQLYQKDDSQSRIQPPCRMAAAVSTID
jgi:hypothetical protein